MLCFGSALSAVLLSSCCDRTALSSGLDPEAFRTDSTALYVISNSAGMEACITNYGARVVSLCVPDRDGTLRDVVVGFPDILNYSAKPISHGALIGPYANRIARGRFQLDGIEYELELNDGSNCIHGGSRTWRCMCFDVVEAGDNSLKMKLLKPDGQFGFPGNVKIQVTYTVTADNRLDILYEALTDAPTVLNITNHSFFNLSGDSSKDALDHILFVDADAFTPTDDTQIPTGEFRSVEGGPFDFRTPKPVGRDINSGDEQLSGGYDHNFVLNHPGNASIVAASLCCPATGIRMDVYTDQPGIQVFSANKANPALVCKNGKAPVDHGAVCLETQHFPDSPNHPEFPSTVLRPGEKFTSRTVYAFSVEP